MTKRTILLFVPVCLLLASFFADLALAYDDSYQEAEVIAEVREKILSNYVEEVPREKLLKGALQGMTSVLDFYSEYLEPESYRQVFESTEGEFVGIGIVIGIEEGLLTIISPMDDSPAAKAGIMAGDKILAINGETAEGITLNEAVLKLRGKKGSRVTLTILREGKKTTDNIDVERDVIHIHSIKDAKMVDEQAGIGYLRLIRFNKHKIGRASCRERV